MNFKIETIHAVVGVDEQDGDEEVWGFRGDDGYWVPMIMADEARFRSVIPIALQLAKESGKAFRIIRFSQREDVTEEFLRQYS